MIVLPWRSGLTTNHIYRATPTGGRTLTVTARLWRQEVVERVVLDWGPIRAIMVPDGPLAISVRLYPPPGPQPDVDGIHKLLQDAVAEALGFDDRRFTSLHVRRCRPSDADPRFEVEISHDEEAAQEENGDDPTMKQETRSEDYPRIRITDAAGKPVVLTDALRRRLLAAVGRARGRGTTRLDR